MNDILDAFGRLNLKLVQLLFDSAEQFSDTIEASNLNIIHVGLDPEALVIRDEFTLKLNEKESPLEKRLIYYYSVRYYNDVAHNILTHSLISLGDLYALLSEPNLFEKIPFHVQAYGDEEHYRSTVLPSGHRIWANASFCIEKTVSFLDFTTKYVFELSHTKPGTIPRKPKASNAIFGKWKDAKLAKGTALSTWSDELRLIHTLRDETFITEPSRIFQKFTSTRLVLKSRGGLCFYRTMRTAYF